MSWSTSELRVRLAPLNRFKPSSKIFYWQFQGGTSFVDLLCFCSVLCLLCFVRVCLYVLCGHLLGKGWPLGSRLWCLLWVCHFPIGILGQVWYLIVSIPDLCNLITFISNTGADPLKNHKATIQLASIQWWTIICPPVKCHLNGILLAGWWWPTFNAIWILSPLMKKEKKRKNNNKKMSELDPLWQNFLDPP